ncbi:LisH domain-containing protein ARMC9 [Geodia barretti]|uniref:LisH domain-containing protein ARMC9 n=1 Tax=Geodia barretti TaxID=519541 RepID=A0AA35R5B8_GEOBA|nr:LisH domain-containing protein ARMC9 [Geodia barretti]
MLQTFIFSLHFASKPLLLSTCLTPTFCIFPSLSPLSLLKTGDRTRSLHQFTGYLSTRSTVLSKNPELSAYYALPYVPDPTSHPSFKKLFTESWSSDLKSRLLHFLKLSLKGASQQPVLLSLYLTNKVSPTSEGSAQEVVLLREQLADSRRHYSERLAEIQDSYHTLVGIALELLDTLESAIAGRQVTPESIQNICSRLFGSSLPDAVASGRHQAWNCHLHPATVCHFHERQVHSFSFLYPLSFLSPFSSRSVYRLQSVSTPRPPSPPPSPSLPALPGLTRQHPDSAHPHRADLVKSHTPSSSTARFPPTKKHAAVQQ